MTPDTEIEEENVTVGFHIELCFQNETNTKVTFILNGTTPLDVVDNLPAMLDELRSKILHYADGK